MPRNQNAHGNLAAGVPLVGQPRFNLLCKFGHYEETTAPFQMVLPASDGTAAALTICRRCWAQFIGDEFEMRRLSDEEAEALKAKQEALKATREDTRS